MLHPHTLPPLVALALLLPVGTLVDTCGEPAPSGPAPYVEHLAPAATDVLQLSIRAQEVGRGAQVPYVPQPGDVVSQPAPPDNPHRWVTRDGEIIGALVGPDDALLWTFDTLSGPPLSTEWADNPTNYLLVSDTDSRYTQGLAPVSVSRKSKGDGFAQVGKDERVVPQVHEVFLRLPFPLSTGHTYEVRFADGAFEGGTFTPAVLAFDDHQTRSPAVHVSQVGFTPNSFAKRAYLSTWTGTAGPLDYPEGQAFFVVDTGSGGVFASGATRLRLALGAAETGSTNTTLAEVHELDLSALTRPGNYRACVAGIGCSYPFDVSEDVWASAFRVSARYLLHGRSGELLDPATADHERPRDHHPADPWVTVRVSTTPLMDTANGLNGDDENNFDRLIAGLLPEDQTLGLEAWGGYHDAGDWDRRIQHLEASILLLDLVDLFPETFVSFDLGIPSDGGVPDLVEEALQHIDFYRRLQLRSGDDIGGVRGGIEHDAHPRQGEASWQDTNLTIAYAPDPWSSWLYAGAAATLAHVCNGIGRTDLAQTYRESAEAAMTWAEAEDLSAYLTSDNTQVRDARNFAAAALYRLTGEARYQQIFLATTNFTTGPGPVVGQRHGAWAYARSTWPGTDQAVRTHCIAAYTESAGEQVEAVAATGFGWAKARGTVLGLGAFSTVLDSYLMGRAHYLTGDERILEALRYMVQTGSGANPLNLSYTTGVGVNPVRQPLHVDSRMTDLPTPNGITVLGPADESLPFIGLSLYHRLVFSSTYDPPIDAWPILECYHDAYLDPLITEFTIHNTVAPNLFAWGYLTGASAASR